MSWRPLSRTPKPLRSITVVATRRASNAQPARPRSQVHLEMLEMRRRMAHEEVVRKQLAVAWDYVAYLREGGEREVVTTTAITMPGCSLG